MKFRGAGGRPPGSAELEWNVATELGNGFEDELREFLAADDVDVDADPLFRERLRRQLWALLLKQMADDDPGSPGETN